MFCEVRGTDVLEEPTASIIEINLFLMSSSSIIHDYLSAAEAGVVELLNRCSLLSLHKCCCVQFIAVIRQ
jgi:hypothetical protein